MKVVVIVAVGFIICQRWDATPARIASQDAS